MHPLCTLFSFTNTYLRGETGLGKWSVVVKDTQINEHNGTFTDWKLTFWGSAIDPEKQELHPLPSEHDDDDHDIVTASVGFASITHGGAEEPSANPSDHIHRPVNAKPTAPPPIKSTVSSTVASSSTAAAADEVSSTPSPIPSSSLNSTTSSGDHFLPHLFPTFGVGKKTQIWIYCSLLLIILFCSGLGAYFYVQRRKRRQRDSRDDYEFDTLPGDEDGQTNGIAAARGKKGKNRRRGGELYDAFAAGSEDEDEGLLSESEAENDREGEERYRDEGQGREMEERR